MAGEKEDGQDEQKKAYRIDVNKHARYFQMVLNGIPSKSQDMQRALIAFFCLCGLEILGELHRVDKIRPQIVAWLKKTQMETNGGFRGSTTFGHVENDLDTPHITMTSASLLALLILGEDIADDDALKLEELAGSLSKFQLPDGSFQSTLLPNDESDVRFAYSAACVFFVLKMIDARRAKNAQSKLVSSSTMNLDGMTQYLASCFTSENAFTVKPNLESHAGAVFCCLASLKMTEKLDDVLCNGRREALIKWLLRRQNVDGGFNGRPNKPSDSCYFFWVGGSLAILDAIKFVDPASVLGFCQSVEDKVIGGYGKLPGCVADPLHTYLTLAGLSLFGTFKEVLGPVNAALCCPQRSVDAFLARD